jgi:acetyltransferase-like isoleucine patch superfamily enzyme
MMASPPRRPGAGPGSGPSGDARPRLGPTICTGLAIGPRESPPPSEIPPAIAAAPRFVRAGPPPLSGGVLGFLRFARANHMLSWRYALLIARWAWLKLRWRGRLVTDGLCFVGPGVKFEIGRGATVHLGRWSWLGHDCKVRVHEGSLRIGAKTVFGQECTISAFQHISIGRECIVADRVMMIDFDHGVVEVERPIREQGIYKRDVDIGHNVWIGYGACLLRGVQVGDNAVIGTSSVVTADVPANAVVGGIPAKLIRMRRAPRTFRWESPGGE